MRRPGHPYLNVPPRLCDLEVEVCVCNASVWEPSELADIERAQLDWAIHVGGHAQILAALRPSLRSVVAVSDIHVERPRKGYVWYTAAKAALQGLVLALASEWAPQVRCNVVQPGALPFPQSWVDSDEAERIRRSVPLGRLGAFDDLAAAVAWLAVEAQYVTGQVLAVDGGRGRYLP